MMHVKVLCGATDSLTEAINGLRRSCWGLFFTNLEFLDDGHDGHAIHFLVLSEETVIAAARLCIHTHLPNVSELHLCRTLDIAKYPGPYGCLNRLVVDARFRGRGLAAMLDRMRVETAETLECRTIIASWNPHSGDRRRQALQAQGFMTTSNNKPMPDGGFGMSFPYAKRIGARRVHAADVGGSWWRRACGHHNEPGARHETALA